MLYYERKIQKSNQYKSKASFRHWILSHFNKLQWNVPDWHNLFSQRSHYLCSACQNRMWSTCLQQDTGLRLMMCDFLLILLIPQAALSTSPGPDATSTWHLHSYIPLMHLHILSNCPFCLEAAPECLVPSNSYSNIPAQKHNHGVISVLVINDYALWCLLGAAVDLKGLRVWKL